MNRRQQLDNKIQELQEELDKLIKERNNMPKFNMESLSWRNILNTSGKFICFKSIIKASKIANELDYPYYIWNDKILASDGNYVVAIYDRETDKFKEA